MRSGLLEPPEADEAAAQQDQGFVEFEASFPSYGEAFELVEQGEGLLDDVAELAQALDVRGALAGDHRQDPAAPQLPTYGLGVARLVTRDGFGSPSWAAGPSGDGRDAADQVEGLSLTFAAVVTTCSGVPLPSQIRWCLLPVLRRSTGDGPVAAPPFSREPGSRPRMRDSSRVRWLRSARRAARGAVTRRRRPSAIGPVAASRSVRSRNPAPGSGVARPCTGGRRTGCPAGIAGPPPASATVTD
ncbi:hypothetical protein RKD20_008144 [Streptomyces sp. SLBN-8D4]|jgi:hypothetical protein